MSLIKQAFHIVFSMAVIVSMLAPPICNLLNINEDVIAVVDAPEEEKSQKIEKDAKEKILQFMNAFADNSDFDLRNSLNSNYLDKDYSYLQEILLPPPKHTL